MKQADSRDVEEGANIMPRFSPGQIVTWVSAPGGRRRLRGNIFAGLSRLIPAVVVSAGVKFVTIEAEGRTYRVKSRNLRSEAI